MKLFYPLGLLGLLGIIVLVIIYLIKPNYQQKIISSTLVWKLSLKYRKKRLPINRFRNLIILFCQILIITAGAFIVARPYLPDALGMNTDEKIIIIDASASMLARQGDDVTRFERAVSQIKTLGQDVISSKNDRISLILADQNARMILPRSDSINSFNNTLDNLIELNEMALPKGCSFGEADVEGAMDIAEDYLRQNPLAEVMFYTATEYEEVTGVTRVDVSKKGINETNREWNAAILDCVTTFSENYFRFSVEVASYNLNRDIEVFFVAYGVNGAPKDKAETAVRRVAECRENNSVVMQFNDLKINTYSSVHIYISADDSFSYDNHYYLYTGHREELRIIYVSAAANDYFGAVMPSIRNALQSRWDIVYETTSLPQLEFENRLLRGYDLYIFEHAMPDLLPTDGVVLMINPDKAPINSDFQLGGIIHRLNLPDDECTLFPAERSELMTLIDPSNILVNRYKIVISSDYKPLMYARTNFDTHPVLLVKNTDEKKFIVSSYSSYYSDLTMRYEFPTMLFNIINCMLPATVKQHVYDIGKSIVFDQSNAVIAEMKPIIGVEGGWSSQGGSVTYDKDYDKIPMLIPGPYSVKQTLLSNRDVEENYFVKVSAQESNFTRIGAYTAPIIPKVDFDDLDIYIYIAAILCAAVFIERLLHVKDEF